MRLNEKYYTRTIHGLAECDGKRINDDYAVIGPWFTEVKGQVAKRNRYYVIHIKSGLAIMKGYYNTIKDAVNNFESDLSEAYEIIGEKNFNDKIEYAISQFNELMERKEFYLKEECR